jgi:hypothetical protein
MVPGNLNFVYLLINQKPYEQSVRTEVASHSLSIDEPKNVPVSSASGHPSDVR